MSAVGPPDGLHSVAQLERALSAVQQQKPGQVAEQTVDVVIVARARSHRRHLAGIVRASTLGHHRPSASRSFSPPAHEAAPVLASVTLAPDAT
jgi:hypothetical protein